MSDLDGNLLDDDAVRQAAGEDFGQTVRRLPLAVLKPGSARDLQKLIQFANRYDLKVAVRGSGCALFGNTQIQDGVVVDTSPLNSIQFRESAGRRVVEIGAGARWAQIWDATYAERQRPPVNVDQGALSLGGIVSTAGFGGESWRDGFVVDHVLELQVVTGQGELLACSEARHAELFHAALGGMGQCCVITQVVTTLVPAPTHVLFFVLTYPDLQSAVTDLAMLVGDGRFSHLDGRTAAKPAGGFSYQLEAGAFLDSPTPPAEEWLLAKLNFSSRTVRLMTYPEYYRRVSYPPRQPHPWLYLCLPASRFVEFANSVYASPKEVAFSAPRFSLWRRSGFRRPLARLPDEQQVARFQLSRNLPPTADIAEAVAMNRTLYDRARSVGGTRLTTSALQFTAADWQRHYGSAWDPFLAATKRFNPKGVLTSEQPIFGAG
ncbi:MAG TPA: FAD-binding protein [Burkholderiaceae bacterium]|nr:FAD-binding protein [Burkholderiaceae bacterium]